MTTARALELEVSDVDVTPLSSGALVAVPNGKAFNILRGLFRQGQQLVPMEVAERPEHLMFVWTAEATEAGLLVRKDDQEVLDAVARAGHRLSLPIVDALLTVAHGRHGRDGTWAIERVAELLYGPRRPGRSRHHHLVQIKPFLALLERGQFFLDGTAVPRDTLTARKAAATPQGRKARRQRDEDYKLRYSARVTWEPVVVVDRVSRTVRVHQELMTLTQMAVTTAGAFRLNEPGHRNPHGNHPSRATKVRLRIGASRGERKNRESRKLPGSKKKGPQRLSFAEILRLGGLDSEKLARHRRMQRHLDTALVEIGRCAEKRGVAFGAPLQRGRRPEECLMLLVNVHELEEKAAKAKASSSPTGRAAEPSTNVIPLGTSSGSATSNGPPRPFRVPLPGSPK